MKINTELSPSENILSLISTNNNNVVLNEEVVSLGTAAENADQAKQGNTTLLVTAIPAKGYKDNVRVTYSRLSLRSVAVLPEHTVIHATPEMTVEELKTAICSALGLANDATVAFRDKTQDDIKPPSETRYSVAELTVSLGSLLYLPDVETFEVYLGDPEVPGLTWNTSRKQTWSNERW